MTDVLEAVPSLLTGLEVAGQHNVPRPEMLDHIRHAIRQQHPQVWRQPDRPERMVLLGSGPSLNEHEDDIARLIYEGAALVTMNGSYHWALQRHFRPGATVVLDGRASSARFVTPWTPRCNYYLASQCHPDVWSTVAGYDSAAIWHAVGPDEADLTALLDGFYGDGHWQSIVGATTVGTRAIGLLRQLGYRRFDVFGVDSCWLDGEHHALPQPENATELALRVIVDPTDGRPRREFTCAPWHVAQLDDFLQVMQHLGHHFQLSVHGRGLLAYAIETLGSAGISVGEVPADKGVA